MSIALNQGRETSLLQLGGDIDIAVAGELKAALVQALNADREISVSIDSAASLDATAFQLLWAAARDAKHKGIKFALTPESGAIVDRALDCMGLGGLLAG